MQSGGSIQMWRAYFGHENVMYDGVDIDPATQHWQNALTRVVIADASSPLALTRTVSKPVNLKP